jgi:hypothetical protein
MHYGCLVRCNGNYEIIVDDTDGVDGFLIKLDVYGTKEETRARILFFQKLVATSPVLNDNTIVELYKCPY